MIGEHEDKEFLEIQESLKDLPMTWYVSLMTTLVTESYKQGTWRPGGASDCVRNIEKKIREGTV